MPLELLEICVLYTFNKELVFEHISLIYYCSAESFSHSVKVNIMRMSDNLITEAEFPKCND